MPVTQRPQPGPVSGVPEQPPAARRRAASAPPPTATAALTDQPALAPAASSQVAPRTLASASEPPFQPSEVPAGTPKRRVLVRRTRAVRVAKYLLPVAALVLLSSIALWPEISRTIERGRVTWHRLTMIDPASGTMKHPRYRGYDGQNQPYTVIAEAADRIGLDRYNLRLPRGDMTMHNGTWLQVRSKRGAYFQHTGLLDLFQDVMLYRQDGTIMTSASATVDMRGGAATSADATHAEGPFGQLDAEGFTLLDKGNIVQFHGPAKLVLNGSH